MNTLTVKLKQHTPLIHFQHDQDGATLRASEVKPKLDKFIFAKFGNGDITAGKAIIQREHKDWIIGTEGHEALNYKMRINCPQASIWDMRWQIGINRQGSPRYASFPMFFGNMGETSDKKLLFCNSYITLILTSNIKELLSEIEKRIYIFFFLNNFGMRQSKGFGSFIPEGGNIRDDIENNYNYDRFEYNCNKPSTRDDFYNIFQAIDYFNKTIRSGINQNGVYLKSLMFFYAADEMGEYWDKRAIRYRFRHFMNPDRGESFERDEYGEHIEEKAKLYRDMLGLSSTQSWHAYNDTITKESSNVENDRIDRFKSPILIKPIHKNERLYVYLIPLDIPAQYLNLKFIIRSAIRHDSFEMSTPSSFNTVDYLKYIAANDIRDYVIDELRFQLQNGNLTATGRNIANTIINIYRTLRFF